MRWRHLPLILCFGLVAKAHGCTAHPLLQPAPGVHVAQPQPWLRWQGDPALGYRVQVEVVVPEVGVVATHDQQVTGSTWQLPDPGLARIASVKVLVRSGCDAAGLEEHRASPAEFILDLRQRCAWPEGIVRREGQAITWPKVAGATMYHVRLFRAPRSGWGLPELVASSTTAATLFAMPAGAYAPAVVATVQPQCASGAGSVRALRLGD